MAVDSPTDRRVTFSYVVGGSVSKYVFISYAREDSEYVEKLAGFLSKSGIDAWYDAQLVTGRRFDDAIQKKIEQCAAFILIMTPAARASDWVHDELDFAKEHDRDLMPILLQGEKFFGLGPIQFEDLRNGEMPSQQFVMVLRGLVGEGDMLFQMKAHKGQIRSVAYRRTIHRWSPAQAQKCVYAFGTQARGLFVGRSSAPPGRSRSPRPATASRRAALAMPSTCGTRRAAN